MMSIFYFYDIIMCIFRTRYVSDLNSLKVDKCKIIVFHSKCDFVLKRNKIEFGFGHPLIINLIL